MPSTMEKANSMLLFIDNTWELPVKQDYPLVWETMKTAISDICFYRVSLKRDVHFEAINESASCYGMH